MTVSISITHQPIAFLPMASGPDVNQVRSRLKRIYVACSSGAISVFQMDDPRSLFASWKTFRFKRRCTAWQSTLKLTVSMRRSRKQTAKRSARMVIYEAIAHRELALCVDMNQVTQPSGHSLQVSAHSSEPQKVQECITAFCGRWRWCV